MNFEPGVVFGMADEDYFSVPALSASGLKYLRISPLDYYMRTEWLGKLKGEEPPEESFARILGKAYHARILEGRAVFLTRYTGELDKSDYKDLMVTNDDLKAELERLGLPKTVKRKQDAIDRLLEADPTIGTRIWDVLLESHFDANPGKVFLPSALLTKIELSAAMIERSAALGKVFNGGYPEVAIFWIDPETGCPCKAKIDYLKPKATIDLKTFENKMGRDIKRAVEYEFANNRYPFQGTYYYQAVEAAIPLIKAGKVSGQAEQSFLDKVVAADPDQRKFLFVFQQKGPAPVACGRIFNRFSATYQICAARIEANRRTYVEYMEKFGKTPWVFDMPIEEFTDEETPPWSTE